MNIGSCLRQCTVGHLLALISFVFCLSVASPSSSALSSVFPGGINNTDKEKQPKGAARRFRENNALARPEGSSKGEQGRALKERASSAKKKKARAKQKKRGATLPRESRRLSRNSSRGLAPAAWSLFFHKFAAWLVLARVRDCGRILCRSTPHRRPEPKVSPLTVFFSFPGDLILGPA